MEQRIRSMIAGFIAESPDNRLPDSTERMIDEPLVAFAAAGDPLFEQYKTVIGPFHLTPAELAAAERREFTINQGGETQPLRRAELVAADRTESVWQPRTVICWCLPITAETRASNAAERTFPSRRWAQTRHLGEQLNGMLRRQVVAWLEQQGFHAVAPQLSPAWRELAESPAGIASTWSERHAAYAAGLGTFSLNDALITPAGIAHRLGSVICDLQLKPTPRTCSDRRSHCLYHREGTCGACIRRCPVQALSPAGHDKERCRAYVYGTVPAAVGAAYGVSATGCGLCQTGVPCEAGIPPGRMPYPLNPGGRP